MIDAIHQFGPNVVRFQLTTGEQKCYIIGCYLAPDDALMIESALVALREIPWEAKRLVMGDFNA